MLRTAWASTPLKTMAETLCVLYESSLGYGRLEVEEFEEIGSEESTAQVWPAPPLPSVCPGPRRGRGSLVNSATHTDKPTNLVNSAPHTDKPTNRS